MDVLDVSFFFNMLRIVIGERWIFEFIYFNYFINYIIFLVCFNIIFNNRTVVMVIYLFFFMILVYSIRFFFILYNYV